MRKFMALAAGLTLSIWIAGCGQGTTAGAPQTSGSSRETAVSSSEADGAPETSQAAQTAPQADDFDSCNILNITHGDIAKKNSHGDVPEIAETDIIITNTGNQSVSNFSYEYTILKNDGSYTEPQRHGIQGQIPLVPGISIKDSITSEFKSVAYSDVKDFEIQDYKYVLNGKQYTIDLRQKTVSVKENDRYQAEDFDQVNILQVSAGAVEQLPDEAGPGRAGLGAAPFTITNNGQAAVDSIKVFSYFTNANGENLMEYHPEYYYAMEPGKSLKDMRVCEDAAPYISTFDEIKGFDIAGYEYAQGDRLYQVFLKDHTASSRSIGNVLSDREGKDILKDKLTVTLNSRDKDMDVHTAVNGTLDPAPADEIMLYISILDKDGNCIGQTSTYLDPAGNDSFSTVYDNGFLSDAASWQADYYYYNLNVKDADGNRGYGVYPVVNRVVGSK